MIQIPPSSRPPEWTRDLRVTEITLALRPERPWRAPVDLAGLQRSVLGRAVFEGACTRAHRRCRGCDLAARCEVPGWYDPGKIAGGSHDARPVVPAPSGPGGVEVGLDTPLVLRWWLLGIAPRPSLLVEALVRLARAGLGRDRIPHRVVRLEVRGRGDPVQVVTDDHAAGVWPEPGTLATFAPLPLRVTGARVWARTPLSWREATPERTPTVGEALWSIVNHLRAVVRLQDLRQPPPWPAPVDPGRPWDEARWVERHRTTSQGGQQDLSGWTGAFTLGAEAEAWADALAAATILGAGRGTSSGCGWVGVEWEG